MERLLPAIKFCAVITATVLFLLGIRELKTKQHKKKGFFVSTVLVVLGLLAGTVEAQDKNMKEIAVAELSNKNILRKLVHTKEWKDFKAFWKKLDEVAPKNALSKEDTKYFGGYFGAIDNKEAETLREKVKILTTDLKKYEEQGLVNPLEIELLKKMCVERIFYMNYGLHSMVTRMMPPPSLSGVSFFYGNWGRAGYQQPFA